MSTNSSDEIFDAVRARLLGFQSMEITKPTIAELVGSSSGGYAGSDGNFFDTQAPSELDMDEVWIIMRLLNDQGGSADGGMLRAGYFEFHAYAHGRGRQSECNLVVDIAVEAWNNWMGDEVIIARPPYGRMIVPYINAQNPGDRELCCTRVLLPFTVAPQYLTQYYT